jgi:putative spermidine/putrescine transport system permease protein
VIVFLIAPSFFVIPVSFTKGAFIEWPPQGFSLKWYVAVLGSDLWMSAALRSLVVAALSASLALVIGAPAAFALTRGAFRGKTFWLSLLLSPLIIPSVLIAVALYYFYSRLGLIGTSLGLILAHTVVTIPYVVITVTAVLKTYDIRLDQAAQTLGASRVAVFRRVTFPLIRGGLLAAFLIAFITSFEELTIALFVTGGLANTLPRQLWSDALMAVSPALAAVSTIILMVVTAVIVTFGWLARPSPR